MRDDVRIDSNPRRSRSSRNSRRLRRQKQIRRRLIAMMIAGIILVIALAVVIIKAVTKDRPKDKNTEEEITTEEASTADPTSERLDLIEKADLVAAGYNYDLAIEMIKEYPEYATYQELNNAILKYESDKSLCVEYDINKIGHVFFHSLIVDTDKAFADNYRKDGYNQVMTTVEEFRKILDEMYANGFVLVGLHQMADYEVDESGNQVFTKKSIMLPEGKKAFVMSQDDVNYYAYMEGDGFANRLIIDEKGNPTCEMDNEDGTVSVGEYDVVPILESFIKEHPDFSYQGARAILAVTGYNGVWGYRTAPGFIEETPELNINIDDEIAKAKVVSDGLRAAGYEIASHSWGHRYMGSISIEAFKRDTDRWETEVEPVVGETDIIIYPFGEDIADWREYTADNERYNYFNDVGFRYFCNVDGSTPHWVQLGSNYLRQGRMNLDGYRMYQDYINPELDKLGYFFDVKKVFDTENRPLPVPDM